MYDNIRQQDPAVYDAMMRELQKMRADGLIESSGRQFRLL